MIQMNQIHRSHLSTTLRGVPSRSWGPSANAWFSFSSSKFTRSRIFISRAFYVVIQENVVFFLFYLIPFGSAICVLRCQDVDVSWVELYPAGPSTPIGRGHVVLAYLLRRLVRINRMPYIFITCCYARCSQRGSTNNFPKSVTNQSVRVIRATASCSDLHN